MRQFIAVTFILGLIVVPTVWFLDPGSVESVVATVKPAAEPAASRPLMSDEDKQRVRAIAGAGKDTAAGSQSIVEAMSAVATGLAEALPSGGAGDGATGSVILHVTAAAGGAEQSIDLGATTAAGPVGDRKEIAGLVGELPTAEGGDTAGAEPGDAPRAVAARAVTENAGAPVVVILRHRPTTVATAGQAWLLRVYPTAISWYDLV